MTRRIGLISDTHGLLRSEALSFLTGCDLILHAGDVGDPTVLITLSTICPVVAVRGNNDRGAWAESLPLKVRSCLNGIVVYLLHDLSDLDIDPVSEGIQVVVSGHSHRPKVNTDAGITFVNPGSIGPRRFKLPITLGELLIRPSLATIRLHQLEIRDNLFISLGSDYQLGLPFLFEDKKVSSTGPSRS